MMKTLLVTLSLSVSVFTLSTNAYAQTAPTSSTPNTTQTDQSEEDWRKSKKKSDSDDPFGGFKNSNGWGSGTQQSHSPVDMLPEESRRFLMKERAQRLAKAGVGEPVDTAFEPSPGAKADTNLQADEKAAWEEMTQGLNGSAATPPAQTASAGQPSTTPPSPQGQAGSPSAPTSPSVPSVMRGSSNATVADILAQIKGRGAPSPSAQPASSQAPSQSAKAQGQASSDSQAQAQAAAQAAAQSQAQSQSQTQSQAQSQTQSQAQSQADAQSQAASQSAAQADAQAAAQAAATARSSMPADTMSALDRIQNRKSGSTSSARSSASDYLKKGN